MHDLAKLRPSNKPRFIRKQKLKDVADIDYGFAFNSDFFNEDGNGLPLVRIRDLKRGFTKTYTTEIFDERYLVDSGDMLIGMDGEFNLTVWQAGPALLNQRVCRIRAKKSQVREDYLRFFLPVSLKRIEDRTSCVTVKHLSAKVLNEITLPGHSLTEQQALADKFIYIEKATTLAIKNSAYLDNLIKSRFIEMFEHPSGNQRYVKLESILREPASNGFFAKRVDYTDAGNVYVLGVANAVNRMYSKVDNLPKTTASLRDIEKYSLSYGDMLFCRFSLVSEGIGKASIVPIGVRPKTLFECHIIRMPLNLDVCIPEFMQIQTTMGPFRKQVISKAKTATMTTIDQKSLLQCDVFLPPIEEQQSFRTFIRQVDKLRFTTDRPLKCCATSFTPFATIMDGSITPFSRTPL